MIPQSVAAIIDEQFLEAEASKYLTRKERKTKKKVKSSGYRQPAVPNLRRIHPKTAAQRLVVEAFDNDKNLILHGCAGTGKTFLALYLALNAMLNGHGPKPVVIIRSVVPVRDIGHMPGRLNEKISLYEATYQGIVSEICDKSYELLKQNGYIDFTSTSYLRGMTYRDCTIIVDECQNMSEAEIHTVMTRVGEGCRVIFCGDFFQKDYMKESSGINTLLKIASKMRSFEIIQFSKEDVVRSGFVREYLFSRLELEEQGAL